MNIEKGDLSYLGKIVTVTVDRPMGSAHPDYPDTVYTVNYGYVEGVTAPDGEPQDAYILGVDTPVEDFTGMVIGVIVREDDNEDKWVVVPAQKAGTDICYECNVMHEVNFIEENYRTKFFPKYEKTSGSIMFRYIDGERRYLLLKSKRGHIGFPKGHIEYGETELMNAEREVREETGLTFKRYGDFRAEYTYTTLENSIKTGVFFLSEFDEEPVFQEEEVKGSWLLKFDEAVKMLNFPQEVTLLEDAEKYLSERE